MNNGNFNREPSPESSAPLSPRRDRSPFFSCLVLLFGLMGIGGMFGLGHPSFGLAAAILGLIDRHLSPKWDTKSKIGTVLGLIVLAFTLLTVILAVGMYLGSPDLGAQFTSTLRSLAEISSSAMAVPGR